MLVFATAYTPLVMGLAWIRGKAPARIDLIRFSIALIGIYLFIEASGHVSLLGILLAVLNTVTYSVHSILVEWHLSEYKTPTITLHIMTYMTIVFGVAYLASGDG